MLLPPNEFSTPPPLLPVFVDEFAVGVMVRLAFCESVRKSLAVVSFIERFAGSLSGTTLRSTTSSTSMSRDDATKNY